MAEQSSTSHGPAPTRHLTDESLADLAYASKTGSIDAGQPRYADHLILCAECREALATTIRVLEALQNPVEMEEPPPELWDRIAADLGSEFAPDANDSESAATNTAAAEPPYADPAEERSTVHYLRPRRNLSWWTPLAAAASGLLIGGAAVAGILLNQADAEEPPPVATTTVIGEATLDPVAAEEFSGAASMFETEQGTMEITVEITSAPEADDGYFELWLRDEDASRLHSLGAVSPGTTTIEVPVGIDLGEYPVVDVSHEHFDGDPGHGGVTLAAGAMEQAGE
ncbi:anti-sigma factor [Nesterenkonia natronophila]|nr:anti-sigma factor [Nesterenkonia natronophila]